MNSVQIGGYVLAGGQSSRMGQEKALLELGGLPLIQLAVKKLRSICAEVQILSRNPALAAFAPLVEDLHPGTGPIGGIEAALIHTRFDWNLILPVDVPFVPVSLLAWWITQFAEYESSGVHVGMFKVDGRPQPTVLLLHRSVAPYLTHAIARGEHRLRSSLEEAACALARRQGLPESRGLRVIDLDAELLRELPEPAETSISLWFANLNTPADLAEAARHSERIDRALVTEPEHP